MFRFVTRILFRNTNIWELFRNPQALLLTMEEKSGYRSMKLPTVTTPLSATFSTIGLDQIKKPVKIQNVESSQDRVLKVVWTDGSASRFPYLFLRENCKCPECCHPSSKQRQINTFVEVGPNIKPKEVQTTEQGKQLKCLWPDSHESVYSTCWLRERRLLEPEERDSRIRNEESIVKDETVLWDRERMQNKFLNFDYDTIMHNDRDLFNYLYALYQYGLVLLDNAPITDGVLKMFSKRIGHLKPTLYGNVFDVTDKSDPNNVAYTAQKLDFHCDLPYLNPVPHIQCLHCIRQISSGGFTLFVDGFNVVKQLIKTNPDVFKTLCNFAVPFVYEGQDTFGEYFVSYSGPTIRLNRNGRLTDVVYSNAFMMDSFTDATSDEILKFYDAYYEFSRLLNLPENVVEMHLQPGQIVAFHNTRVLHGRTEYLSISGSTARWLQGIYLDWDNVFSKLRVIHKKFGMKTPPLP